MDDERTCPTCGYTYRPQHPGTTICHACSWLKVMDCCEAVIYEWLLAVPHASHILVRMAVTYQDWINDMCPATELPLEPGDHRLLLMYLHDFPEQVECELAAAGSVTGRPTEPTLRRSLFELLVTPSFN